MELEKPSALHRKEIYRYLACPENSPAADALLDRCEAELLGRLSPGAYGAFFPASRPRKRCCWMRGTLPATWRAAAGWC